MWDWKILKTAWSLADGGLIPSPDLKIEPRCSHSIVEHIDGQSFIVFGGFLGNKWDMWLEKIIKR